MPMSIDTLSGPVYLDPDLGRNVPQHDGTVDLAIGQAEPPPVAIDQVELIVGVALYHGHLQAGTNAVGVVGKDARGVHEDNGDYEGKCGKLGFDPHNVLSTSQPPSASVKWIDCELRYCGNLTGLH